jgi:RNA polymerase sigma factor (sigma-70 family)
MRGTTTDGPVRSMAFGLGKRRGTTVAPFLAAVSDEGLMAGVAAGDEPALHEFIDRFQRRVYGAALAIVRDQALADEVTQDTFMRVWRRAESFDPRRGTVTGWLMRVTRNIAVDAVRVRRPTAIDPIDLLSLEDTTPGVDAASRATSDMRELLAALPLEQARALVMAGCYGYTAGEISDIEQIPLGTAKTRIRLGLGKLRAAINEVAEEQP